MLLIPQSMGDGHQHRTLTHATTFEEALDVIYKMIGCIDVHRKPNLSYKLGSAPQKEDRITLSSEEDWKGCLDDVAQVQAKKKTTIQVKIIAGKQVCDFVTVGFVHWSGGLGPHSGSHMTTLRKDRRQHHVDYHYSITSHCLSLTIAQEHIWRVHLGDESMI